MRRALLLLEDKSPQRRRATERPALPVHPVEAKRQFAQRIELLAGDRHEGRGSAAVTVDALDLRAFDGIRGVLGDERFQLVVRRSRCDVHDPEPFHGLSYAIMFTPPST